MNITSVKVLLTGNEKGKNGSVKASVSIVLNGSFIMRGISIVEKHGTNDLLVLMPVRKKPNGKHNEYFHPISKQARTVLTETVLDAYQKVKENPKEKIVWYSKEEPSILDVTDIQISPIKDDRLVKAIVTVVLDHSIALNQIRIIHDPKEKKTWIAMPAKKTVNENDDHGNLIYLEFFHPITKEFRAIMTDTILSAFQTDRKAV